MNILVTGANGQLGSEIRNMSKETDHSFIFTGSSEFPLDMKSDDRIRFLIENKIDVIINCAAYTAVDNAELPENYEQVMNVNCNYVKTLVDDALSLDIPVILFSTDYVFDGQSKRPYREDDITDALNVYGYSKLKMEEALKSYTNVFIIRTSWVYGAFGKNFVKTMLRLFKEKESIDVVNDQTGCPTCTGDLTRFIFHLIDNIHKAEPGIYHYSNDGQCSWFDFACEIKRLTGSTCQINPINTKIFSGKARRPAYSVLDKKKVKTIFNIEVPVWKDSLELFLKNYQQ